MSEVRAGDVYRNKSGNYRLMWREYSSNPQTQFSFWVKTFDTFETFPWSAVEFSCAERVPFDEIPVEVLLTAHPDVIEFLKARANR